MSRAQRHAAMPRRQYYAITRCYMLQAQLFSLRYVYFSPMIRYAAIIFRFAATPFFMPALSIDYFRRLAIAAYLLRLRGATPFFDVTLMLATLVMPRQSHVAQRRYRDGANEYAVVTF